LPLVIREIRCILEVMKLSKEFEFFVFLLEKYAAYKGLSAPEVLKIWDNHYVNGDQILTDFIQEMYFIYHQEKIENAFEDIDHILEFGVPLEPDLEFCGD